MKIPRWYLDFLEKYGSIQAIIDEGSSIYLFDTLESQGYHQDYYNENYNDLDFRTLLGNDLGDRALFYSERDGEPGIYVSYSIPDEDYFKYLAPNFESFLFDGVGLKKYADN